LIIYLFIFNKNKIVLFYKKIRDQLKMIQ